MQWHEKVKKFDLPDLINVAVVYEKLGMAAHLSRRDSVIAAQHVEVGRRRVDPAGVLQQNASVVADAERPARKIRRVSRKKNGFRHCVSTDQRVPSTSSTIRR